MKGRSTRTIIPEGAADANDAVVVLYVGGSDYWCENVLTQLNASA